METKPILFESDITEIYNLINENQNSFDDIWHAIKEKIKNSIKKVETKEDAMGYIKSTVNKTKNLPYKVKNKILLFIIFTLMGVFGNTVIMDSLPGELDYLKQGIIQHQGPRQEKTHPTKASEKLRDFIKNEEGFRLKAYDIGDGMITVGWGHAEKKAHSQFRVGQEVSKETVERLFEKDMRWAESNINRMLDKWKKEGINVEINQEMYDAMVSMAYGMGIGNFLRSDFIRLVKHNKMEEAQKRILTTNVSYKGHIKRRQKEAEIFANGLEKLKSAQSILFRHMLRESIKKIVEKEFKY